MNRIRTLVAPKWQPLLKATRCYCNCTFQNVNLMKFPVIKIGEGKLKYILAKVYAHGDMHNSKRVVRAVGSKQYHLDIYDTLRDEAGALDLCTECLGGGIMIHDSHQHYIKLYGRSQTIGRADHQETRELLRETYLNYKIDAESGGMDA